MQVARHGVRATLPRGWEGAIRAAPTPEPAPGDARTLVARSPSILHAGTFALPAERGDFGSNAVEQMGPDDVFLALLEFGPEEVGSALFAPTGLPRRLDPRRFSRRALQRTMPGQAGWQHFFTAAGRPFCLYVVLGDADDALLQVRRAEQLLTTIEIDRNVGHDIGGLVPVPDVDPEEGQG